MNGFPQCDQCRYFERANVTATAWEGEHIDVENRCWALTGHPSPIDGMPMPYIGAEQNRIGGPCGWRGALWEQKPPTPTCERCGSANVRPLFHAGGNSERIGWRCSGCSFGWWEPEPAKASA